MILSPEVLTIFILNLIFALFGTIAFYLSVKIYFGWDLESSSKKQYKLEKQSFLTATIIKYIFAIKVPLFLFFVFTIDKISNVLTGAMCGTGVIDATSYGIYLLILKIINLYLFAYWLVLHSQDMKDEKQRFTKVKFGFFSIIFLLFISELIIESLMFGAIDVDKMVSCCGTIYSATSSSYISTIFQVKSYILLGSFYGVFLLMILSYIFKNKYLYAFLNMLFIFSSLVSLIVFFGTYIYELPTHHCPFCLLQKDYYYIGYLLYTTLFLGTFYGLITGFLPSSKTIIKNNFNKSLFFNIVYVVIISLYPIVYFLKNGVWL